MLSAVAKWVNIPSNSNSGSARRFTARLNLAMLVKPIRPIPVSIPRWTFNGFVQLLAWARWWYSSSQSRDPTVSDTPAAAATLAYSTGVIPRTRLKASIPLSRSSRASSRIATQVPAAPAFRAAWATGTSPCP